MNLFQLFTPNLYAFFTSEAAMATFANLAAQQTQSVKLVHSLPYRHKKHESTNEDKCCDSQSSPLAKEV